MPGAEDLHRRLLHVDAPGLVQVVGQFGVGPVGAVQPLLGRAVEHPLLQQGSQLLRELGPGARGVPGLQAVQAALEVGVEPALDGTWGDIQVSGDVLMGPAALGQQDDLGAVAQAAVVGVSKGLLQEAEFVRR